MQHFLNFVHRCSGFWEVYKVILLLFLRFYLIYLRGLMLIFNINIIWKINRTWTNSSISWSKSTIFFFFYSSTDMKHSINEFSQFKSNELEKWEKLSDSDTFNDLGAITHASRDRQYPFCSSSKRCEVYIFRPLRSLPSPRSCFFCFRFLDIHKITIR
jgi:hypothetical protein